MTPISAPSYPNAEFIPITTFEDNMLLSNVNPPNSYATGDLSQQVALDQAVAAATSDIGTYRADTERFLYQRPTQRSPATVRVGPRAQNGYMHDAGILDYGTNVTAGARAFPGNSLPNSHYRGPHHDPAMYIHDPRVNDSAFPGYGSKWRDTASGALGVRCQLCGNTYSTEDYLGTHMMTDPPSRHGWSTRYYP
ncbi:uncharacterized protein PAC_11570 [Phialocephala subalpina]|uniref:C2H2-type domain-containing protein n=1 Tax=Phialocephala subalpina TaxID=576137 RepID=A0A1L7X9G8_9HELO|nr:uncharacterized protein PAC_11570 [Phialocephala subalpina]